MANLNLWFFFHDHNAKNTGIFMIIYGIIYESMAMFSVNLNLWVFFFYPYLGINSSHPFN